MIAIATKTRTETSTIMDAPVLLGTANGISEKQHTFLMDLYLEGCTISGIETDPEMLANYSELLKKATRKAASEMISEQIKSNRAARKIERIEKPAPAPKTSVVEAGFYKYGNTVAKVATSKTGNLYAKVMSDESWKFEYAPGVIRRLKADDKLTVLEAAKLGHHHGHCMICGRELTVKASVERGIGPVCAGKL